jgi:hypothetical protein
MEAQGFTPQRVKCRLLAAIISDAFETAIFGGATPEQAAEFFSDVINERIRSHR